MCSTCIIVWRQLLSTAWCTRAVKRARVCSAAARLLPGQAACCSGWRRPWHQTTCASSAAAGAGRGKITRCFFVRRGLTAVPGMKMNPRACAKAAEGRAHLSYASCSGLGNTVALGTRGTFLLGGCRWSSVTLVFCNEWARRATYCSSGCPWHELIDRPKAAAEARAPPGHLSRGNAEQQLLPVSSLRRHYFCAGAAGRLRARGRSSVGAGYIGYPWCGQTTSVSQRVYLPQGSQVGSDQRLSFRRTTPLDLSCRDRTSGRPGEVGSEKRLRLGRGHCKFQGCGEAGRFVWILFPPVCSAEWLSLECMCGRPTWLAAGGGYLQQ